MEENCEFVITDETKPILFPQIRSKLATYMPDQQDDNLVEYILLLLSNCKPRLEVINDLDAFLGSEQAKAFSDDLWDLLQPFSASNVQQTLKIFEESRTHSQSTPRKQDKDMQQVDKGEKYHDAKQQEAQHLQPLSVSHQPQTSPENLASTRIQESRQQISKSKKTAAAAIPTIASSILPTKLRHFAPNKPSTQKQKSLQQQLQSVSRTKQSKSVRRKQPYQPKHIKGSARLLSSALSATVSTAPVSYKQRKESAALNPTPAIHPDFSKPILDQSFTVTLTGLTNHQKVKKGKRIGENLESETHKDANLQVHNTNVGVISPSAGVKRKVTEVERGDVKDEESKEKSEIDESSEKKIKTSSTEEKTLVRCLFWPECDKGDNCLFHHPSEICKFWPTCRFGDMCLNIHPKPATSAIPCRFGPLCTNPTCAFAHHHKANQEIDCKFGNACFRSDCYFRHPTARNIKINPAATNACRFDPNCKTISCKFRHPLREKLDTDFLTSSLPKTPPHLSTTPQTEVATEKQ